MKQTILLFLLLISLCRISGQVYTVNGYIEDTETGERLAGALIHDSLSSGSAFTNSYGYFTLKTNRDSIILQCSYLGYRTRITSLHLKGDTVLIILLQPQTFSLSEVVINDKRDFIESSRMSSMILPVKILKQLPVLLGETDVLKSLQFLPGVQSGTEGTSGLYVRGGGPDQNLILLDGVTVYNPDHLFGFISVFNADAIKNISLISGGFPARYGGRLSSVVDIRMKEGNNKSFHGEGTIGPIASKVMLEGPLWSEKTAFLISARRSWIDLIAGKLLKNNDIPPYYFYDLTAKLNHTFSNRSRLYLSVYSGKDNVKNINSGNRHESHREISSYEQKQSYGWQNLTAALRWNYIFSGRLFSNTSLAYSNYNYYDRKLINYYFYNKETGEENKDEFSSEFMSGIKDIALRIDFDYTPLQSHKLEFGLQGIYHIFTPYANISRISEFNDDTTSTSFIGSARIKQGVFDFSLYIEDEIVLSSAIKLNLGMRMPVYFTENKTYLSVEPRVSGRYLLNDSWAIKCSYTRMNQFVHLLSSSRITFPTDLWVPVTDKVLPMTADQVAIGSFYNIKDKLEVSIETYYKSMKNLIEYSEGSSFTDAGSWENKVETGGIGKAFGAEFMIKKISGKTTGWVAYTLSKTERKFDNISSGKWFPYKYDRRHDVNIVINHKFNDRIDAGVTWEYASGSLVTLITDAYDSYHSEYDAVVRYFKTRNNYRLPAYHRLDVGISFRKQKRIFYRTWNISVYNAYNHKNIFFIYPYMTGNSGIQQYKTYTLFPIIPSVTYSLKF